MSERVAHVHGWIEDDILVVTLENEVGVSDLRRVPCTNRFDRDIRADLRRAFEDAEQAARKNGAMRITVAPTLEHWMNIQNLGFDPSTQTLIAA